MKYFQGFITTVFFAFSMSTSSAETVNIANGNDFTPFTDESLKRGGMASHIVEEAFKAAGWTVKYHWLPWKRGYQMARLNQIDAAMPWTKRADVTNAFAYTNPILTMHDQVWMRADTTVKTTTDLNGKRGCLPIGYTIPPDRKEMFDGGYYRLETPSDMTSCFQMLASHRVDFIFCNNIQGTSILHSLAFKESQFRPALSSKKVTDLYIVVGKNNGRKKEIIRAFNLGLLRLRESGEYDRILSQH